MAFMKTKKPPTILLSGRNLAIVIVVVVSGLSFALGYFVGRSTVMQEVEVIQEEVIEDVQVQQPAAAPEPEEAIAVPEAETGAEEEAPSPEEIPEDDTMGRYLTETEPLNDREIPRYVEEAEETVEQVTEAVVEDEPSAVTEPETETEPVPAEPGQKRIIKPVPTKPKKKKVALTPSPATHGEKLYSVQVGAYTRLEDAEAFRKKLEGKGYSQVYIYISDQPGVKIPYKVRVGKTYDKKEVQALGEKIKREENISGFLVIAN